MLPSRSSDSYRQLWIAMIVAAVVALVASWVLSTEALVLAANSNTMLPCDISNVISCGTVARHWSSTLLGFPNSFIGMMTLPVIITIAVAGAAGVVFPRWFLRAAQMAVTLGLLFAGWMFYMSYVVIGALCPWCLIVDAAMVVIFTLMTRYNVIHGNCFMKGAYLHRLQRWVSRDYDILVMVSIVVIIGLMIIAKYGKDFL